MADGFTIDFPHADVRALARQMARAEKELGKSTGQAVRFGAWAVASSMGASTKVSKQKRPVREVSTTRKTQRKFEITSHKTGSAHKFTRYAAGKREINRSRFVRVGKSGLAKASWFWGIKALGSSRGSGGKMTKSAKTSGKRFMQVYKNLKGSNPSVTIKNGLGYIMDALRGGPQDVSTAMARGAKQMAHIIDDKVKKGGLFS